MKAIVYWPSRSFARHCTSGDWNDGAFDVEFEWDEGKRRSVREKHGVDRVRAALIFNGDVLSRQDDRREYGEVRTISLGMVDNGVTRLISAWKGGRDEVEEYRARIDAGYRSDEE